MFTKKAFFLSVLFLLLTIPAFIWALNHFSKKTSAQVTSGSTFIGDINIDSGGGRRDSGSVAIVNSSIGNTFDGVYVSGSTLVGAGHAFKKDTTNITVSDLKIGPDTSVSPPGALAGRNQLSGLRSDDGGNNYYNALLVNPVITTDSPGDVYLVGSAFVVSDATTQGATLPDFPTLLSKVTAGEGFFLVYSNTNLNKTGGPSGVVSGGCGSNFCADNSYVYTGGNWVNITSPIIPVTRTIGGVMAAQFKRGTINYISPESPSFTAYLYKPLQSRTWETYAFASGLGIPDIIQNFPNPTAP